MEIKKIFMGNLDFGVTEDELKNLLSPYGTVAGIKINKKKGYAFAEFRNAEEAAKAVQGLNGQKLKDREIRASMEMKPGKAKALSIKKYKERGWNLSKEKFRRTSDNQYLEEGARDFPESGSGDRERPAGSSWGKPKSDYRSKEKSSGYPRPQKKSWGGKPSYSPKAGSPGEREDQGRASGPKKREWTPKKTSYSGKPARKGESSSWGAPKKEWSSKKSSGSSGHTSHGWSDRPGKNESSGDKPYSKPWSAMGSKKKFSKTARPESGGFNRKRSSGSSKPHRGS